MSSPDSIMLHTTYEPITPTRYTADSYRQIVGIEYDRQSLWLPSASKLSTTSEHFNVPADFAGRITNFFECYYLFNPKRERNCHIGAAAMTGASTESKSAYNHAIQILEHHRKAVGDLAIGQWGVIGEFLPESDSEEDEDQEWYGEAYAPGVEAYHSAVGLAQGVAIQTDSIQGPFSLISHTDNLQQFRTSRQEAEFFV